MKLYKKIFLFILLFILIFTIKNNVYASFDFTSSNVDYTLPDLPEYDTDKYIDYVIFYDIENNSYTFVLQPNTGYTYFRTSDSSLVFYLNNTTSIPVKAYRYFVGGDFSWSSVTVNQDSSGCYFTRFNINNNGERCVIYSSVDIFTKEDSTLFYDIGVQSDYIFPYIADTDEILSNLDNYSDILIFPGSLQKRYLPLKFSIYNVISDTDMECIYEISLDTSSSYYVYIIENPDDYWWEVHTSEFKNLLVNGNEYIFILSGNNYCSEFSITRSITYKGTTYVPPTDVEIQTDAINKQTQIIQEQTSVIIQQTEKIKEQTNSIEEQTEVQKSIFERIGEILSYINPLSENFFAYKLVDLLIDALKSLFVPEERFFR